MLTFFTTYKGFHDVYDSYIAFSFYCHLERAWEMYKTCLTLTLLDTWKAQRHKHQYTFEVRLAVIAIIGFCDLKGLQNLHISFKRVGIVSLETWLCRKKTHYSEKTKSCRKYEINMLSSKYFPPTNFRLTGIS